MRYMCRNCGWIYNEEKGELACDIDPDTTFQDLPEGFECPECYTDKENFCPLDE